jgi:pseudouridine kinase
MPVRSPSLSAAPVARDGAVVVIGGCNVDIAGRAALVARPGDSTPGSVRQSPGGVARNIAENLARLGHPVRLVSALGRDAAGRWLRARTAAAGVDVRGCIGVPGAGTAHYLSLHGPDGALLQAVNDMAALESLAPEHLARERRHLQAARAIVVDANLRADTLAWLFAQDLAAPFFADAVSAAKAPRLQPWLARLHTLKLNRAEADALGAPALGTRAARRRFAASLRRAGVQRIALSLGTGGLLLSDADAQDERPAWRAPIRNTTGAGDALMAGLVHAALRGWPAQRAADFALGCAALTLGCAETNHPRFSERAVRALQRRWCAEPAPSRGARPRPAEPATIKAA